MSSHDKKAKRREGGGFTLIELLVVIAIIGFTATVAASRFILHQGPEDARGTQ